MKTPHRIKLFTTEGTDIFNPVTGEYEVVAGEYKTVPCFVNTISKLRVFEEYGNRIDKVISCRFAQEQATFIKAEYNGELYTTIEAIDAPIKGAIRLRRVVE